MLAAVSFAVGITLPNLLLMGLGYFMQRRDVVNKAFIDVASRMVFNYCLPCLLFFSVIGSGVGITDQLTLIKAGFITTMTMFIGAEVYVRFFVDDKRDQGVFVQGVFRSNMAIMSLALVANAYGDDGMSVGAVYMGIMTIVYNILSVITLSRTMKKSVGFLAQIKDIMLAILKNPLIIALVSAFIYKGVVVALPILELPQFIHKTGSLLGAVALPLALICAGATLNVKSMLKPTGLSMQASFARIIIAPIMAVTMGLLFALPPLQMGVLFLMAASPAAAASYVMAKAMGGNDILAANILGFTTVFSMLAIAVGMAALRMHGLA